MQQEWTPTADQGGMQQWPEDQHNMAMQYAGADSNQMWGQMQSNEHWAVPMEQPQMQQQYPYAQQQFQQDLTPMVGQQSPQGFMPQSQMGAMMPEMALQTPQAQYAMPQSQMSPMLPDMAMQTPQMPQMQMAQMQMAPSPVSSSATPTDVDRCMAFVLGDSQLSEDKDLVALQLKAAAELQQCYED